MVSLKKMLPSYLERLSGKVYLARDSIGGYYLYNYSADISTIYISTHCRCKCSDYIPPTIPPTLEDNCFEAYSIQVAGEWRMDAFRQASGKTKKVLLGELNLATFLSKVEI
jgi:hypothetical protein